MSKTTFAQMIDAEGSTTSRLNTSLRFGFSALSAHLLEGTRRNYAADLQREFKEQGLKDIRKAHFAAIQGERKRIEAAIEEAHRVYSRNAPSHSQFTFEMMKLKYDIMLPAQRTQAISEYLNGTSTVIDPLEVQLLCSFVKDKPKVHEDFLKKMQENDYQRPWLKAIEPADKEFYDKTEHATEHDAAIEFERDGKRGYAFGTVEQYSKMAGIN